MFSKPKGSGADKNQKKSPIFKCVALTVFLKPFYSETEGLVTYFNDSMDLSISAGNLEYILNTLYMRKPFKGYTIHSCVFGSMIFKKDNI
jgi:hypothetical protein